jgi:hypothetical protein
MTTTAKRVHTTGPKKAKSILSEVEGKAKTAQVEAKKLIADKSKSASRFKLPTLSRNAKITLGVIAGLTAVVGIGVAVAITNGELVEDMKDQLADMTGDMSGRWKDISGDVSSSLKKMIIQDRKYLSALGEKLIDIAEDRMDAIKMIKI